jgi:molybdopterin molybdotransferase
LAEIQVFRRPQVRVLVTKPTGATHTDSDGPMICAAIERDGGIVEGSIAVASDRAALAAMLAEHGADIVLVIGGTGPGRDDHSAEALSEAGELAIHGVTLRPSETTGLGRTHSGIPALLLPGAPVACLWSYELFAGRAIRRLGGRGTALSYPQREMKLVRKVVSSLGMTEIVPVRRSAGDGVEPIPSFAESGLMAAVGGDGVVIVPEGSEGFPQGARVTAYLYEDEPTTAEVGP